MGFCTEKNSSNKKPANLLFVFWAKAPNGHFHSEPSPIHILQRYDGQNSPPVAVTQSNKKLYQTEPKSYF